MTDAALATTTPSTRSAWERLRSHRDWMGFWFMAPAAAILLFFLAYPLGLGIWLSFTDAKIGKAGSFVGIENYDWLSDDKVFWARSSSRSSTRPSPRS